ncbi:hypothetical protein FQA47_011280 [Oryzias melastigma]|uniref:Uncharacterized protein n=1 Tax=Oryzias melastigma TaxID=30732 RepID=A0A834CQN9_ORYME|nr:hypothetical protein FQA47_011280 [Oryzias melastigma]
MTSDGRRCSSATSVCNGTSAFTLLLLKPRNNFLGRFMLLSGKEANSGVSGAVLTLSRSGPEVDVEAGRRRNARCYLESSHN